MLSLKNRRAASSASATKKDGGTTSGCSRGRRSGCILRRKPLWTAAIKAYRECTPTRRCQKSAAKRNHYPQATEPKTAPSPATGCLARTSSQCSSASKSSLTVTEIAAAVSPCASSSSPQSTTGNSRPHDGNARGLIIDKRVRDAVRQDQVC